MEKARSRRNPFPTVSLVLLPPFPPCLLLFIASNDSVTRYKPWWSHYNKAAVSLLLHMNGHFCTGPVRLVYQPGSSSYEFHIQIYVAFYKSLPISSSGRVKLNSYVNFKSGHPWTLKIILPVTNKNFLSWLIKKKQKVFVTFLQTHTHTHTQCSATHLDTGK